MRTRTRGRSGPEEARRLQRRSGLPGIFWREIGSWRPRGMRSDGESSVRHRADFFFDLHGVHHDDGVPWAAIEETAVGALAEAFLAADAQNRVNLDSPKRRTILVRHPEHAVFHRAILHAGRRSRAAGAAFG